MVPSKSFSATRRPRASAFTLIELLAVLVIISILAWVLVRNVTGATDMMMVETTRTTAQQMTMAIAQYVDDQGQAPRATFPTEAGTPPNTENVGAECLYLALCAKSGPGFGKFEEHFSNTDEDQLSKRLEGFEKPTLFELCDAWGNPYAYFSRQDYGRDDTYVTIHPETGETITSVARAIKNEQTGLFFEPTGFQIISAGEDAEFGTGDDITAPFKVKRE
jgi:prepilin-type N-terminal cleavage/methylation domain-containing protein